MGTSNAPGSGRIIPSRLGTERRCDAVKIVLVVPFLDEAEYLPGFFDSLLSQTRLPDAVLLVDDGSSDRSLAVAEEFCGRSRIDVSVLSRARRPPVRDRLADAAELRAFQWGVRQIADDWEVVAKVDGDVLFAPKAIETIERAFRDNPCLGMAGVVLRERRGDGSLAPMGDLPSPPEHVEGPVKFYRRDCFTDISPICPILGWDTADEFDARRHGWQTASFEVPDGQCIHARRMGTHGPILRSFRRWGLCAWGYGAHPLHVVCFGALLMARRRPRIIGGLNFFLGWSLGATRGAPRVEAGLRAEVRKRQLAGLRRRVSGLPRELATGTRARYDPGREC